MSWMNRYSIIPPRCIRCIPHQINGDLFFAVGFPQIGKGKNGFALHDHCTSALAKVGFRKEPKGEAFFLCLPGFEPGI